MSWIDIEQSRELSPTLPIKSHPPMRRELSKKDKRRIAHFLHLEQISKLTKAERKRLKKLHRIERLKKKTEKKPTFVKPKYDEYINSPEWKVRRDEYLAKFGRVCQACLSKEHITVHHTHYGYLGREKDKHLEALCWTCHKEFHNIYGTKTVLQKETAEFIKIKRLK